MEIIVLFLIACYFNCTLYISLFSYLIYYLFIFIYTLSWLIYF